MDDALGSRNSRRGGYPFYRSTYKIYILHPLKVTLMTSRCVMYVALVDRGRSLNEIAYFSE